MACITAIVCSKRDPRLATVQVDGKAVARLGVNAVSDLGLWVGQAWDAKLAATVQDAAAFDQAMRAAMGCIRRRAKSRQQLRQLLRTRGHGSAVVERVVEKLERLGLIDDRALGEAVIRSTTRQQPAGPRLLRAKLEHHGLDDSLIDALIATHEGDHAASPVEQAIQLVHQQINAHTHRAGADPQAIQRRLWGLLSRRGFDADTIEAALAKAQEIRTAPLRP